MTRPRDLAVSAVFASLAFACHRAPDDLREWRPSDHHHQTESRPGNDPGAPQVTGSAEPAPPGLEQVTIAAWRRACAPCHGDFGRGDGPQGAMVHARDLTDPAWQAAASDAQIETTITKGRGLMPPAALPPETVANLVKLVRLLNRDHGPTGPNGRAPSAAPSASTGTPAPSAR